MKTLFTILLGLSLFSCSNNGRTKTESNIVNDYKKDSVSERIQAADTIERIIHQLVELSASDFKKSTKENKINFRQVVLKTMKKSNGEIVYLICGEYAVDSNKEASVWIPFATIKTGDYEQWQGTSAIGFCNDSKQVANVSIDINRELEAQFNR